MRAVKAAVIIMGVLLLAGFILVVVTIVGRLSPDLPEVLGEIRVGVPAGCSLADSWSEGGRLFLRYDGAAACRQVVIVDQAEARVLGRVLSVEE